MSSADAQHDDQSQYQVRFDWGLAGAAAVAADVDVIVWVDQLGATETRLPSGLVVAGSIQARASVARWALARQDAKGDRFTIAVIAAGESRATASDENTAPDATSLRFAVEDLLAAGAVIDALAGLGIDHCSPEAAAAAASYTGLRHAVKHLIAASATSRALGKPPIDLTETTKVDVLQEFSQRP